jgi:hypothetical protein
MVRQRRRRGSPGTSWLSILPGAGHCRCFKDATSLRQPSFASHFLQGAHQNCRHIETYPIACTRRAGDGANPPLISTWNFNNAVRLTASHHLAWRALRGTNTCVLKRLAHMLSYYSSSGGVSLNHSRRLHV